MNDKTSPVPVKAGGASDKPYTTPTLVKGPILSDIAAFPAPLSPAARRSDIRLKRDIRPLGRTEHGLTLYRFRYLWSDVEMVGVMAHEVLNVAPEAVIVGPDGFFRVDYARLGLGCVTYADWLTENRLKPYAHPTLVKGPILSDIAAFPTPVVSLHVSDRRLKRDIRPLGRSEHGLTLYRFRYLWSDVEMVGVMAQEVQTIKPEAVTIAPDGFFRVDYARLGLSCVTYADWRAENPLVEAA